MNHRFHPAVPLAMAAVLMASTALAVPGNRQEREEKASVAAKGKVALTIKNARGRAVIVGRPDATSVSIVAVKTVVARDDADAKQMLDRLQMNVSEQDDRVVIETQDDNKYEDWGWSVMSVVKGNRRSSWIDYTIEVPVQFRVSASTTSGEVRISNIEGRADVMATSGDVTLRGIGAGGQVSMTSGDLEASDIRSDFSVTATSGNVSVENVKGKLQVGGTSGDFHISQVEGNVVAELTSGDFILDGCSGDVMFRAASGDARMTEVGGSVDASSSSGDLQVQISPVGERKFNFSSSSGDIDISYLPAKNYGFHLDISTNSGSIEGDMPIKVSRVDRRRLQGVVGSGAARIEIETASGDISLVEKSDAAIKPAR
ncbi:MAG TPA: DUF4097 family beta strand repeat-containing protein [Candidatus Krumholzibacteria bacterium]|nr:DUF4097 family beta strand repeat-containing protein [Candidatus Krumholzibacteria bacterium]